MSKDCSICGENKQLDDFYDHYLGVGGKMSDCKECFKKKVRTRYAAIEDKTISRYKNMSTLEYKRKYREKNRHLINEYQKKYRLTKKSQINKV